jgi:hypothetical protein
MNGTNVNILIKQIKENSFQEIKAHHAYDEACPF